MALALVLTAALTAPLKTSTAEAAVADDLLAKYKASGAKGFDAGRGGEMWGKESKEGKSSQPRSCVTCHTKDLKQAGKHAETGETIKPLAPSANPERLTDAKFIEKWFNRNCKWTYGRECTSQEKGDFLMFIRSR